jgi:hypothetical protein
MGHNVHKKSSVGTLLILAAIDMLTASLVCAVVLFLVLVGSESSEVAATSGAEVHDAPSIAFVYFSGSAGPALAGAAAAPLESTNTDDPLLSAVLGVAPYSVQTYRIKGGEHRLVIERSSAVALLEIYPGNGNPLRLVVACKILNAPVTVSFGNESVIDGSCSPTDSSPAVTFPKGTRIRFIQRPGDQPPQLGPEDWEDAEPSVATREGNRLLTLRAKRAASSQALGTSAKIAEIVN